jgi:hypothetical protein
MSEKGEDAGEEGVQEVGPGTLGRAREAVTRRRTLDAISAFLSRRGNVAETW